MISNCNKYINDQTNGIFAGKLMIVPNTQYTATDIANQYSWTTAVKLYANSMQTVMNTYIQAYNMSSYVPS